MIDLENGKIEIVWATENADQFIADMARVSAPENIGKDPVNLIGYLVRERHWSPFEMVNMTVRFITSRDVGRQVLRHQLKPQEFSQRYANVAKLGNPILKEARMQDTENRQNSLPCSDSSVSKWWMEVQQKNWDNAIDIYNKALEKGIAKEVARSVLPEGNTPTLMYFNGFIRNWLHFCQLRMGNGTQKECTKIAEGIYEKLKEVAPNTCAAFEKYHGAP